MLLPLLVVLPGLMLLLVLLLVVLPGLMLLLLMMLLVLVLLLGLVVGVVFVEYDNRLWLLLVCYLA